jgi:hypothetical protein
MILIWSNSPRLATEWTATIETSNGVDTIVRMSTCGAFGQFTWFAAGAWLGVVFPLAGEALLRTPVPVPSNRDLPLEWLVVALIPVCLMMAGIFATWISIRSRASGRSYRVAWITPLFLGVCYLPAVFGATCLFIRVSGQGQEILFGTLILALMFGLPGAFGELTLRIGKRTQLPSPSGRS